MHRMKVRVVEDALDANNTIARANRDDFDRAGVTVVNLMSAPGRGQDDAARARARPSARRRARRRARGRRAGQLRRRPPRRACTSRSTSSTPTPASAASAISTPTWCARRCPSLPLDEIDLLIIENVGNLVCPAEFRVGEDARVMVSSVAEGEDKPLKYPLMFRACELVRASTRSTCSRTSTSTSTASSTTSTPSTRASSDLLISARTGEGVEALRDWLARGWRARGSAPPRDAARRRGRARGAARTAHRGATRASSRPRPSGSRGCATAMAERFARGGRLIALGARRPARSDVRHVAVEFVHPVIVGKRALPAIGLAGEGGPLADRSR